MKKIFILALFLYSSISYGQFGIGLHAAGIHANKTFVPGIGARVIYSVNDQIDGVLSVGAFFPESLDNSKHQYVTVDIDGHYNFEISYTFKVYGLAGINYTTYSITPSGNGTKIKTSSPGVNIGGGGIYSLDSFDVYGEMKYLVGDDALGGFVWNLGGLFRF